MAIKPYIVRCMVTAEVCEAWRVMAASGEEAISIMCGDAEGDLEFLRDTVMGEEENRRDFDATLESDETDVEITPEAGIATQKRVKMAELVESVARMTTSTEDGAGDHESVQVLDYLITRARSIIAGDLS